MREKEKSVKRICLRSTGFRQSEFIWSRTKVHRSDEGYVWVPKMRDFAEYLSEEFWESKVSGLGSVHEAS